MKPAKRSIVLGVAILIFAPTVFSQGSVTIDEVEGLYGGGPWYNDTIPIGSPITFKVRLSNFNPYGVELDGFMHGFKVYSNDGATWAPISGELSPDLCSYFDLICDKWLHGVTGSGADTIGFGAAILFAGLPHGWDDIAFTITTQIDNPGNEGRTLCIDSAWFPPGGTWMWSFQSYPNYPPAWDGNYCFPIFQAPNNPPYITNNPGYIVNNHCEPFFYDFEASDDEGDDYWFELLAGPGTIDPGTGVWFYDPEIWEVGIHVLHLRACDAFGCGTDEYVDIEVINELPIFISGCDSISGQAETEIAHYFEVDPVDCDPITVFIDNVYPVPSGPFSLTGVGDFIFEPTATDTGTFVFTIGADDGSGDYVVCDLTVIVYPPSPIPGLTFYQIDFVYDSNEVINSDWGQLWANVDEVTAYYGITDGFLNIYTDQEWVVYNLWLDTADGIDELMTSFAILDTPGVDVVSLSAYVEFLPEPIDSFYDGPRTIFPVLTDTICDGGTDTSAAAWLFLTGKPEKKRGGGPGGKKKGAPRKNNIPNVQAAKSQCVSMGVANSLEWLRREYGLPIEQPHVPGIRGDGSLVGTLDEYMGRYCGNPPDRKKGKGLTPRKMTDGKFKYMNEHKLRNKIICRYQGSAWLPAGTSYSKHRCTAVNESNANGHVTFEWIKEQLDNGEDVELYYGRYDNQGNRHGGHCVMVTQPWIEVNGDRSINVTHDQKQAHRSSGDSRGPVNERIVLKGDDPMEYIPAKDSDYKRYVEFAFSESADTDMDGIPNLLDNAPDLYNPDQADANQNGIGDVAESEYLQIDLVLPIDLDIAGSEGAYGPVYNYMPLTPDYKVMWFEGDAYNYDEDTSRIVIAFEYLNDQDQWVSSPYKDTVFVPPYGEDLLFSAITLDFCPEEVGVKFKTLDGHVEVMSGLFYHICYGWDGCCLDDRGNFDGDEEDKVNIVDLTSTVDYLFGGGEAPPCFEEGDMNADDIVNIVDLTYLVAYLFSGGPEPLPCPYSK